MKKLLAVVLAAMLLFGTVIPAFAGTASTADEFAGYTSSETVENTFNAVIDKLIAVIVKVLNFFIPGLNWTNKWQTVNNYQARAFYPGEESFDTQVSADAVWSMGYAAESLLKDVDIYDGEHFLAGTLEITQGRVPQDNFDDQCVYTYAVSDGVSGTVVHAVIDGFGFARGDVMEIRSRLADFAKEHNIIAINISVLHQHSCIDTFGMATPILPALLNNPGATLINGTVNTGKNAEFIENLYTVTEQTVKDAVYNMTEGELYYGNVDVSDYIHDKREPIVFDGNMNRFRFVPFDETKNEIWVAEASIHCVGKGAGSETLTSDYPYYLKQYVKQTTGADVVYVQGAELALTAEYDMIDDSITDSKERIKTMGEALAQKLCSVENDKKLEPVLNISMKEIAIDADNQILILAAREGLINSVVVKDGLGYQIMTEIGYMELGNSVGIFLAPGELTPEVVYGGACSKERSWSNTGWDYAPLKDITDVDTVLCFGLTNDQVGYIITDNDYRSLLTENEEVNVCSRTVASTLVNGYNELLKEVK